MADVYAIETPGRGGAANIYFYGPTRKSAERHALNSRCFFLGLVYSIVVLDEKVARARLLRSKAGRAFHQYNKLNAAAYDAELEAING
jgi:hypothetical protein